MGWLPYLVSLLIVLPSHAEMIGLNQPLSQSGESLLYDTKDRLKQVSRKDIRVRYKYDVLGRRIEKNGVSLIYTGDHLLEEYDRSEPNVFIYGIEVDDLIASFPNGYEIENARFPQRDHMKNTMSLVDASGKLLMAYDYEDYGLPLDRATYAPLSRGHENPYLFSGRRFDFETGYYYFRHRYLDPKSGRFLTKDPLGNWSDGKNDGNGYTYVGGNPWTYGDPSGLVSAYSGSRDVAGTEWIDFGGGPSRNEVIAREKARIEEMKAESMGDFMDLAPKIFGPFGVWVKYIDDELKKPVGFHCIECEILTERDPCGLFTFCDEKQESDMEFAMNFVGGGVGRLGKAGGGFLAWIGKKLGFGSDDAARAGAAAGAETLEVGSKGWLVDQMSLMAESIGGNAGSAEAINMVVDTVRKKVVYVGNDVGEYIAGANREGLERVTAHFDFDTRTLDYGITNAIEQTWTTSREEWFEVTKRAIKEAYDAMD